ncbi:unnamed protein product [Mytilus coruscus]|uniref:Uncharacterized protein n=1 Tax=Mytilus coruscus TaxID=42192 RepID=A0A6J7ZVI9_MYTCO|nr:unnamed protein product [Mytilus coruscus]
MSTRIDNRQQDANYEVEFIQVVSASEVFNKLLKEHQDVLTNEKRLTLQRLIVEIYEILNGKSNVRMNIQIQSNNILSHFQIGYWPWRSLLVLNIITMKFHREKDIFDRIRDFLWGNKTYILECVCAVFVMIVTMFTGYATEDIVRLVLAVTGIDIKPNGVISALSNNTK